MIAASFIVCLTGFLGIGIASVLRSRRTAEDYLIAGKSVPPWLAGLSAVATNNSGFMFIGMIGVTYGTGLSSVWLMFGWVVGDLMVSLLTLRPLHRASRAGNVHSYGGLLAHWHGDGNRLLRRLIGLMTILFLTLYAAAQLKAGSKATAVLLDWGDNWGVLLGALLVVVYSTAGGIRASIWTDAAQSLVMLAGMALLIVGGIELAGGWQQAVERMAAVAPGYLDWFPQTSVSGKLLFVLGWLFGGFAVVGQPHIVIRFMSLDNERHINRMRLYYYGWFTLFYAATILVGMLSRIVFSGAGEFDAELALPTMALMVLPDAVVGLVLAALFAATMSTADSLILSCSAAATRDFSEQEGSLHSLWAAKLTTALVLVVAVVIALTGAESVFALVLDAWGLLGSAFAPLLIVQACGNTVPQRVSIPMVLAGVATFLVWQLAGLDAHIYSVAPGMVAGLLAWAAAAQWNHRKKHSVDSST